MASINEMLQQKAYEDAQFRKDAGNAAMATGGALGGYLGLMAGRGAKGRMAGGLIGAMLGGGLGKGLQTQLIQESPAAALLAKLQVQGTLNATEERQLESLLKDSYSG